MKLVAEGHISDTYVRQKEDFVHLLTPRLFLLIRFSVLYTVLWIHEILLYMAVGEAGLFCEISQEISL